jgi:hypothetical protein
MKRLLKFLFLIIVMVMNLSPDSAAQRASKKSNDDNTNIVQLISGNNLNNWVFKLKDPSVDPATVFSIKDNIVHITGNPFGYMRTKMAFSDYKLHVEWRWPGDASNSGVFVQAQLPDTIWLKCIECQLQAGNAGDFICMNGADMNERKDKTKISVKKMEPSSEKPTGEWNNMDIVCKGNSIEVSVNGILQNKATGTSDNKGHICLQSEGKDIEFRNVYVTTLTK